jgi:gliding motility-associated-like protein
VASPGRYYEWNPKVNLSGYEDRTAELTGYQNSFTVSVEDYFGCIFHEQFSIIPHCDTLYPEKSFHMLDTLVSQGEVITLQPSFGSISVPWTPAGGLSCAECEQPVATPASTTLYTAQLSDEFNCMHEELFYIEIELEIPNAITPNDDGFNDRFVIGGLPPGSSLSVYRSDGLLVYSEKNYGDNGWWRGIDENGKSVESGTYWYLLEIPAINETKKGFLFIKR